MKKITLNDFKTNHDFAWALEQLKAGRTVSRGRWQPTPTADSLGVCIVDFVALIPREERAKVTKMQKQFVHERVKDVLVEAHFVRGTTLGLWNPGWVPSAEELLATDWCMGPREYFAHPKTLQLSVATG